MCWDACPCAARTCDCRAGARESVLAAGGGAVGEIVILQTATSAKVTFCYVTDPEGNILELQSWAM